MVYLRFSLIQGIFKDKEDFLNAISLTLKFPPFVVKAPLLIKTLTGAQIYGEYVTNIQLIKFYLATVFYYDAFGDFDPEIIKIIKYFLYKAQDEAYKIEDKEAKCFAYLRAYEKLIFKFMHLSNKKNGEEQDEQLDRAIWSMSDNTMTQLGINSLFTEHSRINTRDRNLISECLNYATAQRKIQKDYDKTFNPNEIKEVVEDLMSEVTEKLETTKVK